MGLELVDDLEAVLDGSQKAERLAEEAPARLRQVAALGQAEDGPQAVTLAEPRVVPRVEELERLHQELDLADAAHAQLDVAPLDPFGAKGLVDLRLHAADLGDDLGGHAWAEDEGADEVEEARGHARVARAEARLDQRLSLPQLRSLLQVRPVALQREDDAARPPLGAEAEIHPKGVALVRHGLERFHDGPRSAGEVVAVRDASLRAARGLPIIAIDEDEVDVGRIVQLVAAELAHADDGQSRRRTVGVPRLSVVLAKLCLGPSPGGGQAHVGQARELFGGDGEIGVAQDIAAADPQKLAILEAAERVPAPLGAVESACALLELDLEIVGEPLAHGAGLEKPREERRAAPQRVGEELAGAAELRQKM